MRDRPRRSLLGLTLALGLGLQFLLVAPVAACSCVGPQPMAAYRGDDTVAIFTAVVEARVARGFPATVTRWFHGGGFLEGNVWFDPGGFNLNEGAVSSCGIDPLPAGGEWMFVAYRIEGRQELGLSLCSPHARLADPEGQAMFADAMATFGGVPVAPSATDPPEAGDPPTGGVLLGAVVPILIAMVGAAGVLLGVFAVVGRRRGPGSGPDAG
jgi:hypothetical protein